MGKELICISDKRFWPSWLLSTILCEVSEELAADIAALIKSQLGCQMLLDRSEKCVSATLLVILNQKQKAAAEGLAKSSVNISLKHLSGLCTVCRDYKQTNKMLWRFRQTRNCTAWSKTVSWSGLNLTILDYLWLLKNTCLYHVLMLLDKIVLWFICLLNNCIWFCVWFLFLWILFHSKVCWFYISND